MSRTAGAALAATLALAGCLRHVTRYEDLRLRDWLLCDDCPSQTRLHAVAVGDRAVAPLSRVLLEGPGSERLDNMGRQLASEWASLDPAGRRLPEPVFVATYLDHYVTRVRSRAALALGEIGGAQALGAITEVLARGDTVPWTVRRTATFAGALNDTSMLDSAAGGFGAVPLHPPWPPGWSRPDSADVANPPYARVLFVLGAGAAGDSLLVVAARPRAALHGSAIADWRGAGEVRLAARDCALSPAAGALVSRRPGAGRVVVLDLDIPAGGCLLVGVRYQAPAGAVATVSLQVLPTRWSDGAR